MEPAAAKIDRRRTRRYWARVPPRSASGRCSVTSSAARCATRRRVEGQFGRLIFGFAVTEALGIFALLIAFLLLFAV